MVTDEMITLKSNRQTTYPLASRTVNRSSTSSVVNVGKFTVVMNASAYFSHPPWTNVLTMAECNQAEISRFTDESANVIDAP